MGWRSLLVLDWHIDAGASGSMLPIDDHMIVLQLNGTTKLKYRLGGMRGSKTVFPGQISIVPGGHDINGSSDTDSHVITVYLRSSVVAQILAQGCMEHQASLVPHVAIIDPVLSGLICGCARARNWQPTKSQAYIDHFALALAAHLSENYSSCPFVPSGNDDRPLSTHILRLIDDYIRTHIAHDIGVTDIARAAGYNSAYFSRIFKRTLGIPPYRYLLNRRVEAVRDSLHTKARLADIAIATGFCNQEHMTRTFRQFHGISPSDYRRESAQRGPALRRRH
ncbi:MAG TPA: AraC family transcriptional regulator [Steroidobacteraceae bacterium]|nr:AraC family transcriptional regulator [Steroidobacteraceae bacterium]